MATPPTAAQGVGNHAAHLFAMSGDEGHLFLFGEGFDLGRRYPEQQILPGQSHEAAQAGTSHDDAQTQGLAEREADILQGDGHAPVQ